MMKMRFHTMLLALSVALAACGSREPEGNAPQVPANETSAATGSMQAMEGMAPQGGGAAEQMQAHMRMMQGADGERMKALLPEHRQMAANMIAGFNQEMKGMNMATDAAWSATVDSLRQDLVRMPEMSADELKAFMPAHEARLNRLMESHRAMMGNMEM